jgi:hypothetical protein
MNLMSKGFHFAIERTAFDIVVVVVVVVSFVG